MDNQLNSGNLNTLIQGQTLIVNARKVSGDKIHLEFAEITNDRKNTSVIGEFNKSDVNFTSSARRAWVTAEPVDAKDLLGVDFGPQAEWYMSPKGEIMDLNILNPTIKGERVQILITETTEPTEWQQANIESSCKKAGKNGPPITHQGGYIFSNTSVVRASKFDGHTLLEMDKVTELETSNVSEEELASMV